MEISINYMRPDGDPRGEAVKIGWLLADKLSSVVYLPPERLRSADVNRSHAKSASRCPAILALENRYVVVRCPFDLHLGFARDKNGVPILKNLLGDKSPVRRSKLNKLLSVVSESEWRYLDRPIIQLSLPYLFIADEPVFISQISPFLHYQDKDPLPGTIFGGRFPIDIWPRPLMWAFEWHNTDKPIRLKRGQPLFYCQFELDGPDRSFQIVEAERTPELENYISQISAAVNYVNQTFSLFKAAREVRPERLLTPVKR